MRGNKISIISNDNNKLELESNDLKYKVKLKNDGSIKKIANVSGYSMGRVEQSVVAIALTYKTPEPSMVAEKEKAKKKKKDKKAKDEAPKAKVDKDAANDMLLYTFATGETVRMRCVAGYEINAQG